MRRLAGSASFLLAALAASVAVAQTSVAVLGVEAGDASLELAQRLSDELREQVRRTSGYTLVPTKDIDEIKLVFGCVDENPACMARAGRSLKATKLLWGTIKKIPTGYNVTLKWLDVPSQRVEKFVSDNIGKLTASFLVPATGAIRVTANVEGAEIMAGPRVVGETGGEPVVLSDVPAGTHLVRVTKSGYEPWTQQVVVRGGQTTDIDAQLEAVAAGTTIEPPPVITDEPPPPASRRGWKIAFWTGAATTVGLAVGMGVTGVMVLDREDEKGDKIRELAEGDPSIRLTSDDACAEAATTPGAGAVKSICDEGKTFATVTNVLLGVMLGSAALSGYFYYKAYMGKEAPAEPAPAADEEDYAFRPAAPEVRWSVNPAAGPSGASLGFQLEF